MVNAGSLAASDGRLLRQQRRWEPDLPNFMRPDNPPVEKGNPEGDWVDTIFRFYRLRDLLTLGILCRVAAIKPFSNPSII